MNNTGPPLGETLGRIYFLLISSCNCYLSFINYIICIWQGDFDAGTVADTLEEISTQNGPFNPNSNSMSSCVSQWNCFKFEIPYRSQTIFKYKFGNKYHKKNTFFC